MTDLAVQISELMVNEQYDEAKKLIQKLPSTSAVAIVLESLLHIDGFIYVDDFVKLAELLGVNWDSYIIEDEEE